jgi:hypothetical protein
MKPVALKLVGREQARFLETASEQELLQQRYARLRDLFSADTPEFITTEPSDRIRISKRIAQADSDFLQQQVPSVMSHGIDDFFESIEIHEHQSERFAFLIPGHQRLIEQLIKHVTVGKIR